MVSISLEEMDIGLQIHKWLCCTAVILMMSCSGGPSTEPDALDAEVDPVDDDGGLEVEVPDPPELPEPPVLTPCPEGWVEVPPEDEDGVATCDPWPDGGPAVLTPCPEGWVEVTDPDSGTVTCDPWPDGDPVTVPALTPCPDGWREVTDSDSGTVTCDPWPETGYEDCAARDEAHFPGESGCTRIGTECPDADWAEDLPTDQEILYVLAGASSGGDGTQGAPFGTIANAMSAASSGTVIALSKGTFDEAVSIAAGVTLWGACVAETIVASSTQSETEATISAAGSGAAARNFQIGGDRMGTMVSGTSVSLDLNEVLIDAASTRAVFVTEGAALTAESVIVRDTQPRQSDGYYGRGLQVGEGAIADITRAVFERNLETGLLVLSEGTTLTLTDVVVRDTQGQESDRLYGNGLWIQEGAQVEVSRSLFDRNHQIGVVAIGEGTTLNFADVVVRDTQGQKSDRLYGNGLWIQEGAQVEVSRSLFDRNHQIGVVAIGEGTTLNFADVVVRDTQPQESDEQFGVGMQVSDGAQVEMNRALFERNREVGITAFDTGTMVNLTDAVIRDTQARESDGTFGQGMQVYEGAQVDIVRALFERNREVGITATHTGTLLNLTDVVISNTQSRESDGMAGRGLEVKQGAQVEVNRALFKQNRGSGILASHTDTILNLNDVVVQDTLSQESDGMFGRGLDVQNGAQVDVNRALFERNRETGISHTGTILNLTDIVIRDTQPRESDGTLGHGLEVAEGAQVEVTRALFEQNREVGILAAHTGTILSLNDVVIQDTLSQESNGMFGRGLNVQEGAQVEVNRALFKQNREAGIGAFGPGTALKLIDIIVTETLESECALTTCVSNGAGIGIGSYAGAQVELERFVVSNSSVCGLQLAYGAFINEEGEIIRFDQGGTMDLHNGMVSQNPIGVNIQTEDFDIYNLMDGVLYVDNEINLDTRELPVPEARIESLEP